MFHCKQTKICSISSYLWQMLRSKSLIKSFLLRKQRITNLNINQFMGGTQCCQGLQQNQQLNSQYQYEFGQDNLQTNVPHTAEIEATDIAVEVILKQCTQKLRQSSKLYKDPKLKSDPIILKASNQEDQLKCFFHRPYHFLKDSETGRGKPYKIINQRDCSSSQILMKNDALQYFSVFLCFLADNSHLIRELIITSPNTFGIHAIYMYINGVRTPIYIDDYILCFKDRPIFSQPIKGTYMWPCILEKAWQKVKGYGSKKISITSPIQVFQHFLSYPFSSYSLSQLDKDTYSNGIKKHILPLNKDRSCIVTSKKAPSHKIGLSGGRHFYLKCMFQFEGETIYYMRNPCGMFDFRGAHSILAPDLQERLKKEAKQQVIAQGNFALQQDEFLQQIQQFLIVHFNKNSDVVSQQLINLQQNYDLYLQITLDRQQQASISVIQQQLQGDYPFYQLTYQIISQQQNKIISGDSNQSGCFGVRSTNLLSDTYQRLPAGQYLIRLKKKMPKKTQKKLVKKNEVLDRIVITGSAQIKIDYSLSESYKGRFFDFLLQYGKNQLSKITNGSRFRQKYFEHGVVWFGDLVFVVIRRLNKYQNEINLEVSFPDQINLECISHNFVNQFTVVRLVQDSMLILLEKRDLTEQTSLGKYLVQKF